MDEWLTENPSSAEAYIPLREYDAALGFDAVTPALIAALEGLQPTGFGNPAPVFRAVAEVVEARPVGMDGAHLKLTLSQEGHRLGGIAFREGPRAGELQGDCPVDALFVPKLNTYMGATSAQLEVKAIANADANARIASIIGDEMALQCDFLTEIIYNNKMDASAREIPPNDRPTGGGLVGGRPPGHAGDCRACAAVHEAAGPRRRPDFTWRPARRPPGLQRRVRLPGGGGDPPGYGRAVLAGVPCAASRAGCRRARRSSGWTSAPWMRLLPDIEQMRDAYRALMQRRGPCGSKTQGQLAHLAEDRAEMDARWALASLLAIADMGLFAIDLAARPAARLLAGRQTRRRAPFGAPCSGGGGVRVTPTSICIMAFTTEWRLNPNGEEPTMSETGRRSRVCQRR